MGETSRALTPTTSASADRLRWLGLALVVVPWLVRATSSTTHLPAWDLDPTIYWLTSPAIGPAGSLLIDALALLGAGLALLSETRAGRAVSRKAIGLALIGSAACAAHAWLLPSPDCAAVKGSLGNERIGAAWLSAVWGAVAVSHAARDERVRRAGAGVGLGFVALLAVRGAHEVVVEHAVTMRSFEADPKRFVESRGWTMESSMARQFIRRISQPEASGWFGLSNVYASVAAFGVAASVGWLVGALRAGGRRWMGVAAASLSCACGAAALYWSDSKGGFAFAGLGLGVLAAGAAARRRALRLGSWIGPACIAAVLGAVAVRGLVGERIGELSVLFRALYIEAAVRIFGSSPATGVGPDGFQQAYLLAKNPLSPEEVSSPHSILFDWAATLGVAGLAWGALLVLGAVVMGRTLVGDEQTGAGAAEGESGESAKMAMLALALATVGAAWVQSPLIPLDLVAVRLAGLGLGCVVAYWAARCGGAWLWRGIAAGGLVLVAHGQFEVTMSLPSSCGLVLGACALSASVGAGSARKGRAGGLGAGVAVGLAVMVGSSAWSSWRWERLLHSGAEGARVVAEFTERLVAVSGGKPSVLHERDELPRILKDLGEELRTTVSPTQEGIEKALLTLDRKRLGAAAMELETAVAMKPGEWRVAREAARLHLRLASGYLHEGNSGRADEAAAEAERVMTPPDPACGSASWLRALALTMESYARARDDRDRLARSYAVLERAARLDPYNLEVAVRLCRIARLLGEGAEARKWAGRAVELDDLARLDREARGLAASDRAELEAAAKGP
ncbi:MAG: O-antigen ligase family protein [Phycisphaerales bacterium]